MTRVTLQVQGMSYLAGMLLIYMEPYEAFVSFANLLNSHYFASLFAMNVDEVGLRARCHLPD